MLTVPHQSLASFMATRLHMSRSQGRAANHPAWDQVLPMLDFTQAPDPAILELVLNWVQEAYGGNARE